MKTIPYWDWKHSTDVIDTKMTTGDKIALIFIGIAIVLFLINIL